MANQRLTVETLTAEQLRAVLHYDAVTGDFTWKPRDALLKSWNTRYAGKIAGSPTKYGYIQIAVFGVLYHGHRLAWLWMTGFWPPAGIDHRDTDTGNNRWSNLRLASQSENRMNSQNRLDNTSGYKGVYLRKKTGKYVAEIVVAGRKHHLGSHDSLEAAHAAYYEAAHRLHGEFARTS